MQKRSRRVSPCSSRSWSTVACSCGRDQMRRMATPRCRPGTAAKRYRVGEPRRTGPSASEQLTCRGTGSNGPSCRHPANALWPRCDRRPW
jgi:hypothetical protein